VAWSRRARLPVRAAHALGLTSARVKRAGHLVPGWSTQSAADWAPIQPSAAQADLLGIRDRDMAAFTEHIVTTLLTDLVRHDALTRSAATVRAILLAGINRPECATNLLAALVTSAPNGGSASAAHGSMRLA
jgi:hypothetical protein